jgi:hypothetical protein
LFVCSAVKINSFGSRTYICSRSFLSRTQTENKNYRNKKIKGQKDIILIRGHIDEYTKTFLTTNVSCMMFLAAEDTGLFSLTVEMTSYQHRKDLEECTFGATR